MSDAEQQRSQLKGMAIVVVLLGLVLVLSGALLWGFSLVLDRMHANPDIIMPPLPPIFDAARAFAERSAVLTAPLGGVMSVAGVVTLRDPRRGRRWLLIVGWLATVAMVALGALWWVESTRASLGVGVATTGIALHVVQAALVVRACAFLGSPTLVAACDEPCA